MRARTGLASWWVGEREAERRMRWRGPRAVGCVGRHTVCELRSMGRCSAARVGLRCVRLQCVAGNRVRLRGVVWR